jgi:hypothetical protein
VLIADATLRRIAGRLTAIALDPPALHGTPALHRTQGGTTVSAWVIAALNALTDGDSVPAVPAASGVEMLDRLARQVQLLPDILRRVEAGQTRESQELGAMSHSPQTPRPI